MSPLATILKNSRLQSLLIVLLLGILIWAIGPMVHLADFYPLEAPLHRVICLLALAILWGITNMFPDQKIVESNRFSNQVNNEIRMMSHNLKETLDRTRSSWINRWFSNSNTNFYLVLGPLNSGKNTLLQTALAELDIDTPSAITNTHLCDYWFFPNTVFISLDGQLFDENPDNKHHSTILNQFTHLLLRHRVNLSGVIITLPLQEMLGDSEQLQLQYENLRLYLQQVQLDYPDTPLNILISKCDRIAGFNEFFETIDDEERNNVCGIEFGLPPYNKPITELFQHQFDEFIQKLNARVIRLLHHEHEKHSCQLIKDFPTQLEILKPLLGRILNEILPNTNLTINGVFFTSSIIQDIPINNLLPAMRQVFKLPSNAQPALEPMQQKAYFIQQLFSQFTLATPQQSSSLNTKQFTRISLIALAAACIIGGFTYHFFQTNFKHFSSAKSVIENANTSPYATTLDKLSALESTMIALDTNKGKKLANEHHLIQEAYKGYWNILQQQFLPELIGQLSNEIKASIQQNHPTDISLFNSLKVYLMLTQAKHVNHNEVAKWFHDYWQINIHSQKQRSQMMRFLSLALKRELPPLPSDTLLVEQARAKLGKVSPSDFVLRLVKQENQAPSIILVKNHTEQIIDPAYNSAPVNLTQILFYDIYHHQIPRNARRIANDFWVYGDDITDELNDELNAENLTHQVRLMYLEQYANFWQNVLNHVRYQNKSDLNQYNKQLKSFVLQSSPLRQLLAIVKFNTSEINNEFEFNDIVAKQFTAINQLNWNNDEQLFESIAKLTADTQNIISSQDPLVAAFEFAKNRMQNPHHADSLNLIFSESKSSPKQLQSFFTALAQNGWDLILSNTENYLNIIWQNFIVPEYDNHINSRYPIFSDATQDIPLAQFARFFAPNGVMATFMNNYVYSFIDKTNYNWTWKKLNNKSIHFSQTTMEMFMRTTLIEKMFFTTQANQPNIRFTLTSLALNPAIKSFAMILDGQEIAYQPEQTQVIPVTWPGPQPDGVTMTFTTATDTSNTVSYNGVWGWFHLLDHAKVNSLTDNGASLKVNFKYDNSPLAEYQVTTESAVNPFNPGILNKFRCPKQLT